MRPVISENGVRYGGRNGRTCSSILQEDSMSCCGLLTVWFITEGGRGKDREREAKKRRGEREGLYGKAEDPSISLPRMRV